MHMQKKHCPKKICKIYKKFSSINRFSIRFTYLPIKYTKLELESVTICFILVSFANLNLESTVDNPDNCLIVI